MRRAIAAVVLGFVLAGEPATAQELDARALPLADAALPEDSFEARRRNPAVYALLYPSAATDNLPLPPVALQWVFDRPTLDEADDDFDLEETLDVFLSSPAVLNFRGSPSVDAVLWLTAPDQRTPPVEVGELGDLLGAEKRRTGRARSLLALESVRPLGEKWGVIAIHWARLFQLSFLELRPDDATRSLLNRGSTVNDGLARIYRTGLDGHATLGVSSAVTWAKAFRLDWLAPEVEGDWREEYWGRRDRTPRLALGLTLRQSLAFAHRRYYGALEFAEEGEALRYRPVIERQKADVAHDTSLDAGAVVQWRSWELGAGVADLLSRFEWDEDERTIYRGPSANGDPLRTRTRALELRPSWRLDARWVGSSTQLSLAWTADLGGTSVGAGAVHHLSPRWALRAGLGLDPRDLVQGGVGARWSARRYGLDLGLRTHSWNVSGERDWAVGMNVFRVR